MKNRKCYLAIGRYFLPVHCGVVKYSGTFFFCLIILSSCQKEWNATFQGRLVYACDGTTPVRGMLIDIHQTDAHDEYWLCHATTDVNGYYSVATEVGGFGKRDYFSLSCNGFAYDTVPIFPDVHPGKELVTSNSTSKVVVMNATLNYYQTVKFHVKNIDVHDPGDAFTELRQIYSNGDPGENILTEILYGPVDTVLYLYHAVESRPFNFKYTSLKNGDFTSGESSVPNTDCFSTLSADVFY
jgi:hypothetical protein